MMTAIECSYCLRLPGARIITAEVAVLGVDLSNLVQVSIGGIAMGSIYSLMAIGYTIIYNSLRLINFAQGDMFMLGATIGYTCFISLNYPFPVSLMISGIAVGIIGIIIERIVFRPLRNFPLFNLIIATIGVSITIRALAQIIWGSQALSFPPVYGSNPIRLNSIVLMPSHLWILLIAVAFIVLLQLFFTMTLLGKSIRATAQNRNAAYLMGINVFRMDSIASFISAGLGAVGGILIAPIFFADTNMGALAGLKGFAAAVLGGFGSIPGAIAGGVILGLTENLSASLISSTYRDAVAFIILIGVLLLRPNGLMGKVRGDIKL